MRLTNKEIKEVLKNWNIRDIKKIKKAEKGVVNHNWIIKTSEDEYILRGLSEDKKIKGLKFELNYINNLKKDGFPYGLPIAIETKRGEKIIKIGRNYIWLYKLIEGNSKEEFGKKELKETAEMMARYHLILEKMGLNNSAGKSKPYVKNLILKETKEYKKNISKMKRGEESDKIYLTEINHLLPILKKLSSKEYGKLKQYPIHRDLNPENIIWKNNKISGVIDFENVSTLNEPLIKDISIVLQLGCSKDGEALDMEKAKHFIKEYKKIRRLDKKEIELLPEIIAAAYIEDFNYAYWMMLHDPERAKLYRLSEYSKAAQWYWKNKNKINKELTK